MSKGEFVPDEVTNPMVASALREEPFASGFLLDGYPRTQAQADTSIRCSPRTARASTACSSFR
nr:nucleoside monophosphate kinase [Nanchangia anserum]